VRLRRADVLHEGVGRGAARRGGPSRLLAGGVVERLLRHGKQLAIVNDAGRVLVVHLGMSGQMRCVAAGERLNGVSHVHCVWHLVGHRGGAESTLFFRDPRRFGGLWAYPTVERLLEDRWKSLGPDALGIRAADLCAALRGRKRPIKAALLDQALIAGVGNIYADESLFAARIHPMSRADRVPPAAVGRLAAEIRAVLRRAIASGGSSLRDYVDANGRQGRTRRLHRVYGRGGEPCMRCGRALDRMVLAQRATVACRSCQHLW
jgi:formamidopyrimidine-DNA glycosylase